MQTEFSDLMEDENSLLSKEMNRPEDEIPSTQVQRQKPTTSNKQGQG